MITNQNSKENFQMEELMVKEKNVIVMEIWNSKVNIKMEENGKEKDMTVTIN